MIIIATSLERSEKEIGSIIYDQIPTIIEKLVKIGPVNPEITG